jgi:hypothetical protein
MILTVLPSALISVRLVAGEAGDRRVEAAAQAALGRADDEQLDLVRARAGDQRGALPLPRPPARLASTASMRSA